MESHRILDMISSPADLKLLTNEELSILASEIREQIITTTSKTGGHVAPSLGVVELILACHSVLDCPHDKLLFDVGHQSYAHKLVTGRLGEFDTLRQFGGMSGFPKASESEYDVHPSGHASDSVSVALGLAMARDLNGGDEKIVTIIGDASLSGGMAFEALNQLGQLQTPMVIILNDNEMSISRNVGALARYLGEKRASREYTRTRDSVQSVLEASGPLGRGLVDLGRNAKDSFKQMVIPGEMLFEKLGITCTAPIPGHDIAALKRALRVCLKADGPTLLHVVTKKGKGYEPAEENPSKFHGIGPYDIATGEVKKGSSSAPKYTSVFSKAIVAEAERDHDIVAITAAMKDGTGLAAFSEKFPKRFIDTGIAEEHAVSMAGGLAKQGMVPVAAIYSTFLQRSYDMILQDVSMLKLHVVLAVDRAGLVGEDGETHHGAFDVGFLRQAPDMKILSPASLAELREMLIWAVEGQKGPVAVRYPRGGDRGYSDSWWESRGGSLVCHKKGEKIAILTYGILINNVLEAEKLLSAGGIHAGVYRLTMPWPLDGQALRDAFAGYDRVIFVEEALRGAGIGEAVGAILGEKTVCRDLGSAYVPHGSLEALYRRQGLDPESIAALAREVLEA